MQNILLLEDDLALAMYYREHLEDAGFIVYHEVNVEQAKVTLSEVSIHILITDIMIRDSNGSLSSRGGFSLISFATLNVRPIPHLIVITGTDSDLHLLDVARTFNVALRLEKPFDIGMLISEVRRLQEEPLVGSNAVVIGEPSNPDDTFSPPDS